MFRRTIRFYSSHCATVTLVGVCFVASVRGTAAQAFLPPAGEGNIAIAYQNSFARGHLDLNGQLMPGESGRDPVQSHSMMWDAEYGLTNRFAVRASLPFVRAKYGGLSPHPIDLHGQPSDVDDGTYHGTFQDVQVGARFRIVSRPATITPFVEAIIPSHHYPSLAHSAVGKDLSRPRRWRRGGRVSRRSQPSDLLSDAALVRSDPTSGRHPPESHSTGCGSRVFHHPSIRREVL